MNSLDKYTKTAAAAAAAPPPAPPPPHLYDWCVIPGHLLLHVQHLAACGQALDLTTSKGTQERGLAFMCGGGRTGSGWLGCVSVCRG
jgi:hypothetical protein